MEKTDSGLYIPSDEPKEDPKPKSFMMAIFAHGVKLTQHLMIDQNRAELLYLDARDAGISRVVFDGWDEDIEGNLCRVLVGTDAQYVVFSNPIPDLMIPAKDRAEAQRKAQATAQGQRVYGATIDPRSALNPKNPRR